MLNAASFWGNCIVGKSAVVLEDAKSEEQKLKKVPSQYRTGRRMPGDSSNALHNKERTKKDDH
jgi:hypothetical protein